MEEVRKVEEEVHERLKSFEVHFAFPFVSVWGFLSLAKAHLFILFP
jgi:hypothetical protein